LRPTDLAVIESLATRFRRVTPELAGDLFGLAEGQARRTLERLCAAGWLGVACVRQALPGLPSPLAVHEAGGGRPDYRAVARVLSARRHGPLRLARAYFATRKAVRLVGGVMPDLSKPHQAGHDLGVVAMCLAVGKARPLLAAGWVGEDCFRAAKPGPGAVPDAVAIDEDGRVRAFEHANQHYTAARLEQLSRRCLDELGFCALEVWG
jgi:hypothetical protein